MGFRFQFRRSIKILPGVRWNISKGGSSLTFGGRGFRHTISKRGARTTVGIPGTGLSYTKVHKPTAMPTPQVPKQPSSPRSNAQRAFYIAGAVLLAVWLLTKLPKALVGPTNSGGTVSHSPSLQISPPAIVNPSTPIVPLAAITPAPPTPTATSVQAAFATATPDLRTTVPRAVPVREQDDLAAQFRQTVVDRAAVLYPDLLDPNSALFRATWSAYYQHKVSNPAFFNYPDWPVELANRTAAALRIPPRQASLAATTLSSPQTLRKQKLLFTPQPAFPYNAGNLRRPASGRFLLKFRSDGTVASVGTVQSTGNAVLDSSATATLRLWRSEPGQNWSTEVPITSETRR